MGYVSQPKNRDGLGALPVQVAVMSLTAIAAGTDTDDCEDAVAGEVVGIEINVVNQVKDTATIKVYEKDTTLAAATRKLILNLTASSLADIYLRPLVAGVSNTGGALTTAVSVPYYVSGILEAALAGANEGDEVDIYVYVKG